MRSANLCHNLDVVSLRAPVSEDDVFLGLSEVDDVFGDEVKLLPVRLNNSKIRVDLLVNPHVHVRVSFLHQRNQLVLHCRVVVVVNDLGQRFRQLLLAPDLQSLQLLLNKTLVKRLVKLTNETRAEELVEFKNSVRG